MNLWLYCCKCAWIIGSLGIFVGRNSNIWSFSGWLTHSLGGSKSWNEMSVLKYSFTSLMYQWMTFVYYVRSYAVFGILHLVVSIPCINEHLTFVFLTFNFCGVWIFNFFRIWTLNLDFVFCLSISNFVRILCLLDFLDLCFVHLYISSILETL